MSYEAIDFSGLMGMDGFSKELLEDHFKLYEGYVTETNALMDQLKAMPENERSSVEHSELRRRLGWEFNGMRLHELYFGNLGGDGRPPVDGDLHKLFSRGRGGFDSWLSEFKSVGKMRGIGWAIFYLDQGRRAETFWIDQHDVGHPAGATPLLVMDVWEHAYMTDYRTNREEYIEAFLANVDWRVVGERLAAARR